MSLQAGYGNFHVSCPYIYNFYEIWTGIWNFMHLQFAGVFNERTDKFKFQIWRYAYYFPAVPVSQCCDRVLMWCFRVASEVNEGVRCWLSNSRSCGTSSCGTECYSGAAHISENTCRLVGRKDPAGRTVTNIASCQADCQLTDSASLAVTALTWYRLYMCECGKAVASSEPWPNV